MNTVLRFAKHLTKYDPLLRERVETLYHNIFEGMGTDTALDNLKAKVGVNKYETEGDGVFGLSASAGMDAAVTPDESVDQAVADGADTAELSDFGTAIPEESLPTTEDDLGLGDDFDTDYGNDLGADESLFADDLGSDDDLGLDGMDDEVPEDGPEAPADGNDDSFGPDGDFSAEDLGI